MKSDSARRRSARTFGSSRLARGNRSYTVFDWSNAFWKRSRACPMSCRAFDRAASCLSAESFRVQPPHFDPRPVEQDLGLLATRPGSQRMIGMRARKLVETLGGPIQLLGLRLGVQQRPGVLQLGDGPLEIQRRPQVGRQVFAGFEPIDLERRVLVIAAIAQPAKKGQLARRSLRGRQADGCAANDQRQEQPATQKRPRANDVPGTSRETSLARERSNPPRCMSVPSDRGLGRSASPLEMRMHLPPFAMPSPQGPETNYSRRPCRATTRA